MDRSAVRDRSRAGVDRLGVRGDTARVPGVARGRGAPGSAIVAFNTPVQAANGQFAAAPSSQADPAALSALNATLAAIGATSVEHLFTNLPADELAGRPRAGEAADRASPSPTSRRSTRSPTTRRSTPGTAANDLAKSKLVSSAMPDWIFIKPTDPAKLTRAQRKRALRRARDGAGGRPGAAARAAGLQRRVAAQERGLPSTTRSPTRTPPPTTSPAPRRCSARSFGQQPGQGEVVTNISLGNVDNNSTVLQNGQRYIVQAGYPKIPVWLSDRTCTPTARAPRPAPSRSIRTGTTGDDQGDFLEVNLDFSVMAPPPLGDPRIVNPAPAGNGQLLGEAYGAQLPPDQPEGQQHRQLRRRVPRRRVPADAEGQRRSPRRSATASAIGGFSDYFFEDEAIIHDVVTTLVDGRDIFVSISAGDGQTDTQVAMNPNGLTEPTKVTTDPTMPVDIDDPNNWANPNYSYGLTNEPHVRDRQRRQRRRRRHAQRRLQQLAVQHQDRPVGQPHAAHDRDALDRPAELPHRQRHAHQRLRAGRRHPDPRPGRERQRRPDQPGGQLSRA